MQPAIMEKIQYIGEAKLPTVYGDFKAAVYEDQKGLEHLLVKTEQLDNHSSVLVRLHSECLTGDVFGSLRCDCGDQLEMALHQIAESGNGMVVYLRQEGRGIGLGNKIKSYVLQDQGMDTVEANVHLGFPPDAREYSVAAAMLQDQHVQKIDLLTNNPGKVNALTQHGIVVEKRVPLIAHNQVARSGYIQTKIEKMGHLIS